MVKMMRARAARKARRLIEGNFHVGSIGGNVGPVPGTGTVEGETKLADLANEAYALARRSAAERRSAAR